MATTPDETKIITPVDTANAAAAELLKGAIEDGAGDEDFFVAKAKV
jgi:hypothetical protein